MSRRRLPSLFLFICVYPCSSVAHVHAAEDADVAKLKAAGIPTDGPGLADYFKRRTTTLSDEVRIKELVRRLGDDEFKVREAASRKLVMLGPHARPYLQAALKDSDPEIVRRAQECLERIARGTTGASLRAAVRVLARRKPPDAAAVLLAYLPSREAEEERIAETIHQVLPSVAVRDGKAEPALVAALADESPLKRAAAAGALGRANLPEVMPKVRELLHDRDASVRLRVGLALASRGEKDAVPALIGLIDDIPLERNGLVLELLARLAADAPPSEMPVVDQKDRHKYRQAWEAWWKNHHEKIARAHLERASHLLGDTLIVLLDLNTIALLDRANEVRWRIENVEMPLDAQLLEDGERVLVAEYRGNRVTERTRKGEILWKKEISGPLMAQRLPNGNTFIAVRNQVLEVDKDGKEVFRYSRPDGGEFMRATKLRNGDIVCIVQTGGALARYVRLTPSGKDYKEVRSWGVRVRTSGGRLDVLPNGHVLIPEMDTNRVVEYDAGGQSVWQASLEQPIAAVRLPNGNTIVTLMLANRAVEVDRTGKEEIWQFKADTRVTRAIRR